MLVDVPHYINEHYYTVRLFYGVLLPAHEGEKMSSHRSERKYRPLISAANVSVVSFRVHNSAIILLFDLFFPCYAHFV